MDNFDCSVTERKGCNYCLRSKSFSTNGVDFFSITDDKENNRTFLSTDGKHFLVVDIMYCPVCGRKFK